MRLKALGDLAVPCDICLVLAGASYITLGQPPAPCTGHTRVPSFCSQWFHAKPCNGSRCLLCNLHLCCERLVNIYQDMEVGNRVNLNVL